MQLLHRFVRLVLGRAQPLLREVRPGLGGLVRPVGLLRGARHGRRVVLQGLAVLRGALKLTLGGPEALLGLADVLPLGLPLLRRGGARR